jgi:hypothetical protein
LELDLERRSLRKAGKIIHLSPKEFELLSFLMLHQNVPITHARWPLAQRPSPTAPLDRIDWPPQFCIDLPPTDV